MINIGIIEGRLTKDPEIRATDQGKSITKFTVAVERNYAGKEGTRESDFISCVAFDKKAEFVDKYFAKGKGICVVGSYRTDSYTNKEGVKVYTTQLVADQIQFPVSSPKSGTEEKKTESQMQIPEGFVGLEDDIPF